jgi:anti-anti-sigma regulatory factor
VIDASAVDRLSTPCVQILLSAVQHMEQHGISFVIRSPSDAFVTAFDDLGLFSYLMKWPVQT